MLEDIDQTLQLRQHEDHGHTWGGNRASYRPGGLCVPLLVADGWAVNVSRIERYRGLSAH